MSDVSDLVKRHQRAMPKKPQDMTDPATMRGDELRDRIAWPIWQNSTLTSEGAADIAQTIIEDLGLVVEGTVRVVDYGGGPLRIPQTRVIGRWER